MISDHPDKQLVHYILQRITEGFRVGFRYGQSQCKSAKSNMLSSDTNPQVVTSYLQKEVPLGKLVGPLPLGSIPGIHISPFGVIPKGHTPGKWRLILDLSSPHGHSVNDGIDLELCSLSYINVDMVGNVVVALGKESLLAKVDIKSAYRIVPVHPEDRPLLGMEWKGALYVDTCLPFGLRSAPRIFTALADMLEWGAKKHGVTHLLHYLDDYYHGGSRVTRVCSKYGDLLRDVQKARSTNCCREV